MSTDPEVTRRGLLGVLLGTSAASLSGALIHSAATPAAAGTWDGGRP